MEVRPPQETPRTPPRVLSLSERIQKRMGESQEPSSALRELTAIETSPREQLPPLGTRVLSLSERLQVRVEEIKRLEAERPTAPQEAVAGEEPSSPVDFRQKVAAMLAEEQENMRANPPHNSEEAAKRVEDFARRVQAATREGVAAITSRAREPVDTAEPVVAHRPPEWPDNLDSPSYLRRGGLAASSPEPPAPSREPLAPDEEIPPEAQPWPPMPESVPRPPKPLPLAGDYDENPPVPPGTPGEPLPEMPPSVQVEGSTSAEAAATSIEPEEPQAKPENSVEVTDFAPTEPEPSQPSESAAQEVPEASFQDTETFIPPPGTPIEPWPVQDVLKNLREKTSAERANPVPEMPTSVAEAAARHAARVNENPE